MQVSRYLGTYLSTNEVHFSMTQVPIGFTNTLYIKLTYSSSFFTIEQAPVLFPLFYFYLMRVVLYFYELLKSHTQHSNSDTQVYSMTKSQVHTACNNVLTRPYIETQGSDLITFFFFHVWLTIANVNVCQAFVCYETYEPDVAYIPSSRCFTRLLIARLVTRRVWVRSHLRY